MIHEILWRRSSFSGGGDDGGGDCVEAATSPTAGSPSATARTLTVVCWSSLAPGRRLVG